MMLNYDGQGMIQKVILSYIAHCTRSSGSACEEEILAVGEWVQRVLFGNALLDLVIRGELEISDFRGGEPVFVKAKEASR